MKIKTHILVASTLAATMGSIYDPGPSVVRNYSDDILDLKSANAKLAEAQLIAHRDRENAAQEKRNRKAT